MASFSPATRELVLKLVYYGPGLGGKTTTLKALHAAVRAEHRGKMISLATPVDRTLYFDFLPVRLPSVGDVQLRLQLFTVPGQVYFNATRKLVLTGADAVVFVADSQVVRLDANIESLANLRDNLVELGRPFDAMPIVLAYNKRDLPDVLSLDELDRELNPQGFPSLPTSASTTAGVFESLDAAVKLALDDLVRRKMIPGEVTLPAGGIIAERLGDVRAPTPAAVEPTRVVTGTPARSPSRGVVASAAAVAGSLAQSAASALAMPAVSSAGPSTPTLVPPALAVAPLSNTASSLRAAAARPTPAHGALPPLPPLPAPSSGAPGASSNASNSASVGAAGALGRRGVSFVAIFDAEDQEAVRTVEEALADGLFPRGVLLVEALVVRLFERSARAMGRPEGSHEALAWALGLPPERYGRVRTAAQRARRGSEVSRRDALESYLFLVQVQLGAEAIGR